MIDDDELTKLWAAVVQLQSEVTHLTATLEKVLRVVAMNADATAQLVEDGVMVRVPPPSNN